MLDFERRSTRTHSVGLLALEQTMVKIDYGMYDCMYVRSMHVCMMCVRMYVYVRMLHEVTVYKELLDIRIFQNSISVFVYELRIADNFVIIT